MSSGIESGTPSADTPSGIGWSASSSRRDAMSAVRWSRFMVPWKTASTPASSAARAPTRCTWMWSGWPYPPWSS